MALERRIGQRVDVEWLVLPTLDSMLEQVGGGARPSPPPPVESTHPHPYVQPAPGHARRVGDSYT